MSEPYGDDEKASRPIACGNCRKRRSYCSKDRPKCQRCHEGNLICNYEDNRKITVNESYLRDLERKAEAYDKRPLPHAQEAVSSDEEEYKDIGQDHLLEPFTQVHIDKPSANYKGPGSSDKFLESVRKLSGFPGNDSNLDVTRDMFEPSALPCRRGTFPMALRLPPLDVARRLFEAQYYYIGTIFAFTDSSEMLTYLPHIYRDPPDPADEAACAMYAKVLIILAFGQLYSVNQWVDSRGPPGFDYFAAALDYLPEAHEEGSIASVETLALVGYFMQNLDRRDAAFLYTGMALRMAISLGLHQEVRGRGHASLAHHGNSDDTDLASRERRRRVWWSVYSLDRILCVKSGNPITISDEDINVNLPSRLPNEPEYCPVIAFQHYTQLSRILGRIHTKIYSKSTWSAPKSGKGLMASVQEIIMSLSTWHEELPEELRFDPAKLRVNRESVSIFAHYYQCINMTVRPLLFHVVKSRLQAIRAGDISSKEDDWKHSLSSSTVRMIDICIGGAQDVVNMMKTASKRDLVATYGYMDGEHISSATIVLVMACKALPYSFSNTAAMQDGLELLREMSERGNSQMGARYELLANISSSMTADQGMSQPTPAFAASFGAMDTSSPMHPAMHPTRASVSSSLDTSSGQDMTFTFPVINNSYLGEPFFDESSSNTGMDFQLWEDGFANQTLSSSFDFL